MYESHNIATAIKTIAKEKNIIIKQMLSDCELGSNTMSAMYHGKSIASDSLARIADYLGVTVDYLLGRDSFSMDHQALQNSVAKNAGNLYALSLKEHKIIEAYRNKPEMQPAVDKLLNIYENTNSVNVYRAAKSEESHPDEIVPMSRERLQKLKDAPETDDIL